MEAEIDESWQGLCQPLSRVAGTPVLDGCGLSHLSQYHGLKGPFAQATIERVMTDAVGSVIERQTVDKRPLGLGGGSWQNLDVTK